MLIKFLSTFIHNITDELSVFASIIGILADAVFIKITNIKAKRNEIMKNEAEKNEHDEDKSTVKFDKKIKFYKCLKGFLIAILITILLALVISVVPVAYNTWLDINEPIDTSSFENSSEFPLQEDSKNESNLSNEHGSVINGTTTKPTENSNKITTTTTTMTSTTTTTTTTTTTKINTTYPVNEIYNDQGYIVNGAFGIKNYETDFFFKYDIHKKEYIGLKSTEFLPPVINANLYFYYRNKELNNVRLSVLVPAAKQNISIYQEISTGFNFDSGDVISFQKNALYKFLVTTPDGSEYKSDTILIESDKDYSITLKSLK